MEDRAHWLTRIGAQSSPLLEAYYQTLYAQSPDIIVTLLADDTIDAINPRGAELVGEDAESLRGQPVGVLFSPGCADAAVGLLRAGYIGESDGVVVLRGGHRATVSVSRPGDGAVTLLILRDISHAHHLQRTIAGINRLAAELAADIATPLAVIEGQIALLLAQPELPPATLREQLRRLRCHSQRISHTVRNLQAVAAPRTARRALSRLDDVLAAALEGVGRRRRHVHVEHLLRPPELRAYADPGQLQQIIHSLVCCAIDRSPVGRTVRISAEADGPRVLIRVEDDGAPPSDEQLAAITETSDGRLPSPPLGLPLTSAWKLAQRNGGSLRIMRREGGGGVALLELPRRASGPAPPGRELLVVDRERLLLETVSWMLSEHDVTITAVSSVEEAAGLCARRRFDVVLMTPPSAGLRAMLRSQQPAHPVRVIQVGEGEGGLQTPFTRQELLTVLGELS